MVANAQSYLVLNKLMDTYRFIKSHVVLMIRLANDTEC